MLFLQTKRDLDQLRNTHECIKEEEDKDIFFFSSFSFYTLA